MGVFNLQKKNKNSSHTVEIRNCGFVDGVNRYEFSNCLIAGGKSAGRDALLRSFIYDGIKHNKSIFVIQNGNALPKNSIRDEFATNGSGRNFFSLDFGKQYFTKPINLFKETQLDFVKELLVLLMSSYKEMTPDNKNFAERYFNEIFDLMQYRLPPVKRFTLNNIADFDADWIEYEAGRLLTTGKIDQKKHQRVVNYVYTDVRGDRPKQREYENFCIELQNKNFADLLSGDLSYRQLNSPQYITFLIMDFIACPKQSNALLKLLIHRAIYEMQTSKTDTIFVFEDIDISAIPEFRELLKACRSSSGNNVYFTTDKITNYTNLDFDPRSYCNSYFVFRQPIMNEAEEWSKTSGTYKKDKATQTTSSYRQVYGERNKGFLGGVANLLYGNKQVVTGTNHEIVDECNVLPSEFMALPERASKVIINAPNGERYIMQVTW